MNKLEDMMQKYSHIRRNHSFKQFGFEVGSGWCDIIEPVIALIDSYNKANPDDMIIIEQVKEKWGLPRIYLNFYTKDIEHAIGYCEMLAETTCMQCGDPGDLRSKNSWLSVKCELHK